MTRGPEGKWVACLQALVDAQSASKLAAYITTNQPRRPFGRFFCTRRAPLLILMKLNDRIAFPCLCTLLAAMCCASNATAHSLPERELIDLGNGVSMEFVLVHPDSFTMGTDTHEPDESPAHRVTLTQPYYIGKYEVTQAQWEAVMKENPSHFRGANHPVDNVSWHDCQRFVAALEKIAGRRFSLPTEAQWEYACRAGSTTEYGFGDDETQLEGHAWYAFNSGLTTHPVGTKRPNAWGLHDMHGNVYEWCEDWYSEGPYARADASGPFGPAAGWRRVLRGGAWLFVPDNLRSSDRAFSPPDLRTNEYGLRCVLLVESSAAPPPAPNRMSLIR